MIQLDIGQLVALMGIPSAITGLCFWMIQRQLSKRDAELDRRDAARERNEVLLVRSVGAAIALGEATATALKNGHGNQRREHLFRRRLQKFDFCGGCLFRGVQRFRNDPCIWPSFITSLSRSKEACHEKGH